MSSIPSEFYQQAKFLIDKGYYPLANPNITVTELAEKLHKKHLREKLEADESEHTRISYDVDNTGRPVKKKKEVVPDGVNRTILDSRP